MLEKMSELAERAAKSASRREFLGRVGRGAMAVAAALGGLLALPGEAFAARRMCSTNSFDAVCRERPVGASCRVGRYMGTCRGAPSCYCSVRGGR
jgi:hypothetical protein